MYPVTGDVYMWVLINACYYAVIVSVLNLLHHSCIVLEVDLVCGTHFISSSLAHAVSSAFRLYKCA